jgi:hypothetical protein
VPKHDLRRWQVANQKEVDNFGLTRTLILENIARDKYTQEQIVQIKKVMCNFCKVINTESISKLFDMIIKGANEDKIDIPSLLKLERQLKEFRTKDEIKRDVRQEDKLAEVIPFPHRQRG